MMSAGLFFLSGLIFARGNTRHRRSEHAQAPCLRRHRSSGRAPLLVACALLSQLCDHQRWANRVNDCCRRALSYFALSVFGYASTERFATPTSIEAPHRLGDKTIPNGAMLSAWFPWSSPRYPAFLVIFSGYVMRETARAPATPWPGLCVRGVVTESSEG